MASYAGKGALSNGSVYVCNLPYGTDDNMLAEYFGTIGLLKVGKFSHNFVYALPVSMRLCFWLY